MQELLQAPDGVFRGSLASSASFRQPVLPAGFPLGLWTADSNSGGSIVVCAIGRGGCYWLCLRCIVLHGMTTRYGGGLLDEVVQRTRDTNRFLFVLGLSKSACRSHGSAAAAASARPNPKPPLLPLPFAQRRLDKHHHAVPSSPEHRFVCSLETPAPAPTHTLPAVSRTVSLARDPLSEPGRLPHTGTPPRPSLHRPSNYIPPSHKP